MVDQYFIHCHIPIKKTFLFHSNSSKHRSESLTRCFQSNLSKGGTHFEQNFLTSKFYWMVYWYLYNVNLHTQETNLQSKEGVSNKLELYLFEFRNHNFRGMKWKLSWRQPIVLTVLWSPAYGSIPIFPIQGRNGYESTVDFTETLQVVARTHDTI